VYTPAYSLESVNDAITRQAQLSNVLYREYYAGICCLSVRPERERNRQYGTPDPLRFSRMTSAAAVVMERRRQTAMTIPYFHPSTAHTKCSHREKKPGSFLREFHFLDRIWSLVLYNPTDVGLGFLAETESHF
jgi:hypothetical protein